MVTARIRNRGNTPIVVDGAHTLLAGEEGSVTTEGAVNIDCGGVNKVVPLTADTDIHVMCGSAKLSQCMSYGPKNPFYSRNNTKQCFERYYIDIMTRKS